jgi:hypothetical protein
MIRLRPSELTLTPADVEETFRRMARRQVTRHPTRTLAGVAAQPGVPALRRGPQRAVRDAIIPLGDIPILRPQPQQATHSSVEHDNDEGSEAQASASRDRNNSVVEPVRIYEDQPASIPTSAVRGLNLPFRFRTARGNLYHQQSTEDHAATASNEHETQLSERDTDNQSGADGPSDPRRARFEARVLATTQGRAELRGGGPQRTSLAHDNARGAAHTPSPLHRVQEASSPRDREAFPSDVELPITPYAHEPTRVLRGYFTDPTKHPSGRSYWFDEHTLAVPQTEPRHRSGRLSIPTRSASSGSAAAHPFSTHRPETSGSYADDVFAAIPAPDPLRWSEQLSHIGNLLDHGSSYGNQARSIPDSGRSRQLTSEASIASGAFSLYELPPESRHSSSGSYPAQYDGTGASRYFSRGGGAYHSVRASEARLASHSSIRPQSSRSFSHSSPNLTAAGQRPSPLPSMPYTRSQQTSTMPQPPVDTSRNASGAALHEIHLDAADAVDRDLRSPLDGFADFYQQSMRLQAARYTLPTQSTSQSQVEDIHNPFSAHDVGGRYDAVDRLHSQRTAAGHHPHGRGAHSIRSNQRSSENIPVGPSTREGGDARSGQVQIQRAAYERLLHAQLAMHEGTSRMTQVPRPRDTSNRPRAPPTNYGFTAMQRVHRRAQQLSSSPLPGLGQLQSSPSDPSTPHPPVVPPRSASRRHPSEVPQRAATRAQRLPAPLTMARTHRRVPVQQRDQENNHVGEQQLMRQEEAAISARYGEEQQRDVMDETPPRVGRVEGRMFS